MTGLTPERIEQIASISFLDTDHNEMTTIKEYLKYILLTYWDEKENFNSKRPFGSGLWYYGIYKALIENNVVDGVVDEDGCVDVLREDQEERANAIISAIIMGLK